MAISNNIRPGRHFLQIPGPTNVPDRVLRALKTLSGTLVGPGI